VGLADVMADASYRVANQFDVFACSVLILNVINNIHIYIKSYYFQLQPKLLSTSKVIILSIKL